MSCCAPPEGKADIPFISPLYQSVNNTLTCLVKKRIKTNENFCLEGYIYSQRKPGLCR